MSIKTREFREYHRESKSHPMLVMLLPFTYQGTDGVFWWIKHCFSLPIILFNIHKLHLFTKVYLKILNLFFENNCSLQECTYRMHLREDNKCQKNLTDTLSLIFTFIKNFVCTCSRSSYLIDLGSQNLLQYCTLSVQCTYCIRYINSLAVKICLLHISINETLLESSSWACLCKSWLFIQYSTVHV